MSRSYRKTKIMPNGSDKSVGWFKRWQQHRNRARLRVKLAHHDFDGLEFDLPYNDWDDPRDGKRYEADYFDGRVWPDWRDHRYYALRAIPKVYDPTLAKKRMSK